MLFGVKEGCKMLIKSSRDGLIRIFKRNEVRWFCFDNTGRDKDFQFLQRSSLPTDHFQDSLPRLPLPRLEHTCDRYLAALRPFVCPERLRRTEQIVAGFRTGEGRELQAELKTRDEKNKHTSYITEPYADFYLRARDPLVINFNPFFIFRDDPDPIYNNQALRATNLILSSLRFMKSLKANILEPEIFHFNPDKSDTKFFKKTMKLIPKRWSWYGSVLFKAFPLDMTQFQNLFSSTRIPRPIRDELRVFPESRHLVVIRKGHFYSFDVLDENGNIYPPLTILRHIRGILSDPRPPCIESVALMTSEKRDMWARMRQHLEESPNSAQLRVVESAIFVLGLDECAMGEDLDVMGHFALCGPVHNRWFDKSFNLMVASDGIAAINFEHSWGDGVAILRYFREVYFDSIAHHFVGPDHMKEAAKPNSTGLTRLDFTLDEIAKTALSEARANVSAAVDRIQVRATYHYYLHRKAIKGFKLSPDAVIQLGLQMGFYKLYGKFVSTYESCSTANFKGGRLETLRPLTCASRRCVEEMLRANRVSNSELRVMFHESARVHRKLVKEASMGQAFDNHLMALKHLSEEKGSRLPDFFLDPSYRESSHHVMSTSTLMGPSFWYAGFGPVVEDGFGISYNLVDDRVGVYVSSFAPHRNAREMMDAMLESFDDIYAVLSNTSPRALEESF